MQRRLLDSDYHIISNSFIYIYIYIYQNLGERHSGRLRKKAQMCDIQHKTTILPARSILTNLYVHARKLVVGKATFVLFWCKREDDTTAK